MIELKTLEFQNIRRFVEKQTINFEGRDRLIQVDGKNENTGGSSGAGKTTVFLALDYLLGVSDIPSTILQSRLTKEPLSVSGTFAVNDKVLSLSRSKKNGLTVEYNGEKVSGNVKLAEEKLEEIIGIPRQVFKKMVHKKQKEGGFFIDMTGKQTYDFLITVLGLDKYNDYVIEISSKIKENLKELDDTKVKIELEKSNIKHFEDMLRQKEKPKKTITEKDLEFINKQIGDLEGQKIQLDVTCSSQLQFLEEPEFNQVPFDNSITTPVKEQLEAAKGKKQPIEKAKNILVKEFAALEAVQLRIGQISSKISELKDTKKSIESSTCPTCQQHWAGDSAKAKAENISAQIDSLASEALECKRKLDCKVELEKKQERLEQMSLEQDNLIKELEQKLQDIQEQNRKHNEAENDRFAEVMKEFRKKEAAIENKYKDQIETLSNGIQKLKVEYSTKKRELELYIDAMKNYDKEIASLAKILMEKKQIIKDLEDKQQSLKTQTLIADETKRLIKSYTLQTFQETLDMIGDMATDILSGIPNMANSTIYFEGCKENKDGSIKDEVTGIINMDGENTPIKSLSGGERTAIDLAVDLAVIDVIETKAGKGADFYIIDEPFDGLDAVCRENCLEILKQIDTNKKIIMVDHSSELKEMVGDIIEVTRSGETSSLTA